MLKSSVSNTIYNQFTSSYQHYGVSEAPFVYVDPNGSVKLLTDVINGKIEDEGIFAVSIAEDGWMEFLAIE